MNAIAPEGSATTAFVAVDPISMPIPAMYVAPCLGFRLVHGRVRCRFAGTLKIAGLRAYQFTKILPAGPASNTPMREGLRP